MITRDAIVERNSDLVTAPMGEELAMMDMDSGTYFVLDEVAAFLWEKLAEATSVSALLGAVQARYDVAPAQCEADVLPFLQRLHAKRLIRVVE